MYYPLDFNGFPKDIKSIQDDPLIVKRNCWPLPESPYVFVFGCDNDCVPLRFREYFSVKRFNDGNFSTMHSAITGWIAFRSASLGLTSPVVASPQISHSDYDPYDPHRYELFETPYSIFEEAREWFRAGSHFPRDRNSKGDLIFNGSDSFSVRPESHLYVAKDTLENRMVLHTVLLFEEILYSQWRFFRRCKDYESANPGGFNPGNRK